VGSPREAPSGLRNAAFLPAQRSELLGAARAPPLHARAPDHSESSLVHAARASPASRGRQLASPDAALEVRERGSRDACIRAPLRQRTPARPLKRRAVCGSVEACTECSHRHHRSGIGRASDDDPEYQRRRTRTPRPGLEAIATVQSTAATALDETRQPSQAPTSLSHPWGCSTLVELGRRTARLSASRETASGSNARADSRSASNALARSPSSARPLPFEEQPSGPALASSARRKDWRCSRLRLYASCGRRRNLQAGYQNSTRRTMQPGRTAGSPHPPTTTAAVGGARCGS
jgi:hypothetical protein